MVSGWPPLSTVFATPRSSIIRWWSFSRAAITGSSVRQTTSATRCAPSPVRVDPVGLVERGLAGHAVEQERHQRHLVPGGDAPDRPARNRGV